MNIESRDSEQSFSHRSEEVVGSYPISKGSLQKQDSRPATGRLAKERWSLRPKRYPVIILEIRQ